MERTQWLREKQRRCEERMDTLFAPIYDEHWGGYINASHRATVERFLALCPPGGAILDAACGTGKYWPLLLAGGRVVTGFDQSGEMLRHARAKYPAVPARKSALQDLDDEGAFDGVVCIDVMENIFPEHWPAVLGNFRRALRPGGALYFTIELADEAELRAAYEEARRRGLPVVAGEHPFVADPRAGAVEEGGYHYYPPLDRVRAWVRAAGFAILEERDGDDYHHVLARATAGDPPPRGG
ncbi:MAG TPA: class I SAM-dependent methyltransferase [Thermomicrobiales bacterium]|nr:class I SAM-dependent methyltransferase [Thermomicrobiales bacterium]